MPTYQYECTECGEPLEVHQSFSDDPLTVCPACGGRLRKVYNAVGVVFKGSGFYRTDSRKGGNESSGSSNSTESSSGEKKAPEKKASETSAASSTSTGSSSTSGSSDSK